MGTPKSNRLFDIALNAMALTGPPVWGPNYVPAKRARRAEAPTKSKPFSVYSVKVQRVVHGHGDAAFAATALALHHDQVMDIHEEHVLCTFKTEHPLANHPIYGHTPWPSTFGTVDIADQMGKAKTHPSARRTIKDEVEVIPMSYIDDLLLLIRDSQGAFLIDWDIKNQTGQHGLPGPDDGARKNNAKALEKSQFRQEVRNTYMKELGIPVKLVAGSEINEQVAANLIRLLTIHAREHHLPPQLEASLLEQFNAALKSGETISSVANRLATGALTQKVIKDAFEQAVWNRQLRVDLFRPILVDHPLHPEVRDVLDVYGHWFKR